VDAHADGQLYSFNDFHAVMPHSPVNREFLRRADALPVGAATPASADAAVV
jgi:hypothetical protein